VKQLAFHHAVDVALADEHPLCGANLSHNEGDFGTRNEAEIVPGFRLARKYSDEIFICTPKHLRVNHVVQSLTIEPRTLGCLRVLASAIYDCERGSSLLGQN
jgi:hypothetical protein